MQSQDQTASLEQAVLIEPALAVETDLADEGAGGAVGIVLGALLIFLAIIIAAANVARERRERPGGN